MEAAAIDTHLGKDGGGRDRHAFGITLHNHLCGVTS
jgi:hypothetical protein